LWGAIFPARRHYFFGDLQRTTPRGGPAGIFRAAGLILLREAAVRRSANRGLLLSSEGDVLDVDALRARLRQGDDDVISELRRSCLGGIRFYLERTFGPDDPDEAAARVFEALVRRIQQGEAGGSLAEAVRSAARDCGFLTPNPVRRLKPPAEKVRLLKQALAKCSALEREYLERCYLRGENPTEVREQLGLSRQEVDALHRKLGVPARMLFKARGAAGGV